MNAHRLPMIPGAEPRIGGEGENLYLFIEPLNSPRIIERIGRERILSETAEFTVSLGQRFQHQDKTVTGGRYLYKNDKGEFIGALNYTKINRTVVISNIYVRPDYRRQGIGTKLVQRAQQDYPRIVVDGSLTNEGAAFFGYTAPNKPSFKP